MLLHAQDWCVLLPGRDSLTSKSLEVCAMWHFRVWLSVVVCLAAFAGNGDCQVSRNWMPQNARGNHPCYPSQTAPKAATSTVQVDVPVPCAPSCIPQTGCSPYPCCPPPCPRPCQTQPVKVKVEVVVRPETPKCCAPQRFCCENPPVFEPVFYHAAWMLRSLVLAPLGLGNRMLGHCPPRVPLPPPVPVACVPCQVAPCPPPAYGCRPPLPCPPPQPPGLQGQTRLPYCNAPMGR